MTNELLNKTRRLRQKNKRGTTSYWLWLWSKVMIGGAAMTRAEKINLMRDPQFRNNFESLYDAGMCMTYTSR